MPPLPQPAKLVRAQVAVLATRASLGQAMRLRHQPDFFELRLDALCHCLTTVDAALPRLRAPLIITARHPAEGGNNRLALRTRRELLVRYLERAAWIDVELRSLGQLAPLIARARGHGIGCIVSCHFLARTPSLSQLQQKLDIAANSGADIFKLVTRTDTPAQMKRLIRFFELNGARAPLAAMGIGKLGAESRRRLARVGSALLYSAVGRPIIAGQPSFAASAARIVK